VCEAVATFVDLPHQKLMGKQLSKLGIPWSVNLVGKTWSCIKVNIVYAYHAAGVIFYLHTSKQRIPRAEEQQ
jgi:spore maturation protein CgeB